jgi:hypothetical protein
MKTAEMRGQLSSTTTFLNGGYDGGDRRARVSADGVLCRRLLMVLMRRQDVSDPTPWTKTRPRAGSQGSLTSCLPTWLLVRWRHGSRPVSVKTARPEPRRQA